MRPAGSSPKRFRGRRRLMLGLWLLACVVILGRAAKVQIFEKAVWQAAALDLHETSLKVPAPRGSILDRNGNALAAGHEKFQVAVAPRELREATRDSVVDLLRRELGLSRGKVGELRDWDRTWVNLQGWHPPGIQEVFASTHGIHLTRGWSRHYPYEGLAEDVLGRVLDGSGTGGIEGAFDQHLEGTPGEETQARDIGGNPIPGQSVLVSPAIAGGDVILTLDRDLQEIGHEVLAAAMQETEAQAGNLIVTNPKTGEILALVSLLAGGRPSLSAVNAPYEPGSTLKPFTVAGVLVHSVASLSDSVDGEEGQWLAGGRMLTDTHAHGMMTLGDALRVSSNVGVAKVAEGLTRPQQYEILRDFGFGTRTGIELKPESPGSLPRPPDWSRTTPSRLAIGYEIAVTPLQMVMAYGALANGGRLMEPRLVRELRDSDSRTIFRSEPHVIREVIPASIAREITDVLVEVVEEGTGTAAHMATFTVAGKSGTSRAYGSQGYEKGHYASFVCFFPVEDPQLVVFVKLDRPKGAYYGGSTAAPVTRATMEAVLAAHQAPIDWEAMTSHTRRQPRTSPLQGAQFTSSRPSSSLPVRTPRTPIQPETGAVVPDVSGLSPRLAVRRLHAHGFRVLLEAPGPVAGTDPSSGTPLAPGDTVRVLARRIGDG